MQFCDIENEAEEFVYFDETNTKVFLGKNFPFPAELNQSRAAVSEGMYQDHRELCTTNYSV